MMTVHEVSRLAGVSIRTLQYYDRIGLLRPAGYTDAGYRLYDDEQLERLQCILLFRELEFPLKDIIAIMDSPDFDRSKALEQQIELLRLKKEHIENLMNFALGIKLTGVKHMDFKAFDRSKLDEYSRQAKELYGNTPEYRQMQEKMKNRSKEEDNLLADRFMLLFKEAGTIKDSDPASPVHSESVTGNISENSTPSDIMRSSAQEFSEDLLAPESEDDLFEEAIDNFRYVDANGNAVEISGSAVKLTNETDVRIASR